MRVVCDIPEGGSDVVAARFCVARASALNGGARSVGERRGERGAVNDRFEMNIHCIG